MINHFIITPPSVSEFGIVKITFISGLADKARPHKLLFTRKSKVTGWNVRRAVGEFSKSNSMDFSNFPDNKSKDMISNPVSRCKTHARLLTELYNAVPIFLCCWKMNMRHLGIECLIGSSIKPSVASPP